MVIGEQGAELIKFLCSVEDLGDMLVLSRHVADRQIHLDTWDPALGVEPTARQIADAEADITVINGQTFGQWLADHGGDPALTRKRKARERVSNVTAESELILAAVAATLDIIRQRVPTLPEPTPQQIADAIRARLT